MTTAARPTFDTARGGQGARERDLSALSKQYSSRDLPSHQSLKTRDRGQSSVEELSGRDLKRELHERERLAAREKGGSNRTSSQQRQLEAASSSSSKKSRLELSASANVDADDPIDESGNENSDDDSDDDDDTAALMAELQKIKQEKAMEEMEREEEKRAEEEKIRMENILTGNPLLKDKYAGADLKVAGDMKVKRRWDDDVVFKNCSRAEPDKKEKTFINDTIRSEFHKKFMDKYIK